MRHAGMHLLAALLWLAACQPASAPGPAQISVRVIHDGESGTVTTAGSVVRDVLSELEISLGALDRVTPSEFTTLMEGMEITVTRVQEKMESEEVVVPFEKQVVRNEGLPVGETRLLQTGSSGL
ncbi:MAG TPA: ubiquitin-like domain-containing protein, partial [Anaerolineales bacterium]|nr:ubiquitin-like domain-containing protein [Anaerolineales bacterium]